MVDHSLNTRQFAGGAPLSARRVPRDAAPAIGPELRGLLKHAHNRAGLCILMLLKRDPTACETVEGFHLRLRYPLDELAKGLASLVAGGILDVSRGHGDPTYWLPADSPHLPALHRLASVYHSGASGRNCLVSNLPGPRA